MLHTSLLFELATARRRGLPAAPPRRPSGDAPVTIAELRPLLARVAELDDDDHAWLGLRDDVVATIARLTDEGELPRHLAVHTDDDPREVLRVLAAAWRYATSAPDRRHHRM